MFKKAITSNRSRLAATRRSPSPSSDSEQIIDADTNFDRPWDFAHRHKGVQRDMGLQRFNVLSHVMYGQDGVNQEATEQASGLPPRTAAGHGVLPQIYLGGEVDVIPEAEACSLHYISPAELQNRLDAAQPGQRAQIREDADWPLLSFGNGREYRIRNLCNGLVPYSDKIPGMDCTPDKILDFYQPGHVLFRDVQGAMNEYGYGRKHMLYLPHTTGPSAPQLPIEELRCQRCEFLCSDGTKNCPCAAEAKCQCRMMNCAECEALPISHGTCTPRYDLSPTGNSAFVASRTGEYGGATRALNIEVDGLPPILPELEWKGHSFVAHHVSGSSGSRGPDGPPWTRSMLRQVWESPAILGLQFWNENDRVASTIKSQQNRKSDDREFHGEERGYDRNDGIYGPKPVDDARSGFWSENGLFEYVPFDIANQRWGEQSVHIDKVLCHGAADWDTFNLRGLIKSETDELEWLPNGEPRRLFMAGGSDAHGDLNYRRSGYFQGAEEANDTAIASPLT